jgi:hypothetical protein
MSRWGIAALALFLCFEAVFAGAPDRDKDFDPPHFLDEVFNLDVGDCSLNLLKVAGQQYKVLSSPLYRFLHQKLIKKRKIHSEMGFQEIDERRALKVGVDLQDLERDRASVRRYLPGLLYDVLLSRVANLVGVAAGRRTGQTYDKFAAQDYFLSWQRPALRSIPDFDEKLRLKISERLFPGFVSFKRLAGELVILDGDDEEREELLLDSLRESLNYLKQYLLPYLYENRILEYFAISVAGLGRADRVSHHERNSIYTWRENTRDRNLHYRQVRTHDLQGPRVLMQTFVMPDASWGVAPLVSASVNLEGDSLGVVLSLPEDLGQNLREFVEGLSEVFSPDAVWDPHAEGP